MGCNDIEIRKSESVAKSQFLLEFLIVNGINWILAYHYILHITSYPNCYTFSSCDLVLITRLQEFDHGGLEFFFFYWGQGGGGSATFGAQKLTRAENFRIGYP